MNTSLISVVLDNPRNRSRLICLLLAVVSVPHFAIASILSVTSTADSGAGTLRNTLASAASGDTIDLSGLGAGATINLTTAGDQTYGPSALLVNKTVTLTGTTQ